jgi:ribosomal protein S18 acetylase RimI-like enzyme
MSALTFVAASARTPEQLVELFHRSFAGYAVAFEFNVDTFLARMRFDLVDFSRSLIAQRDGADIAVALLAPRGRALRVAAMGVVAQARGQGIGRQLMQAIFDRAPEREFELEVLTNNEPAIALYERFRFRKLDRLVGFRAEHARGNADANLREIDLREAARRIACDGDGDLPWQCSAPAMATLGHPHSAWELGPSSLILGDPRANTLRILSILTAPGKRRQGAARRLLEAVLTRHPNRRWLVPPICPSDHAEFFRACGLREHELSQWRMRCDLSA